MSDPVGRPVRQEDAPVWGPGQGKSWTVAKGVAGALVAAGGERRAGGVEYMRRLSERAAAWLDPGARERRASPSLRKAGGAVERDRSGNPP